MESNIVLFSKENTDEMRNIIQCRYGDKFDSAVMRDLSRIVKNANIIALDFSALLKCLDKCSSNYRVLKGALALSQVEEIQALKPNVLLASKVYNVNDDTLTIDGFTEYCERLQSMVGSDGVLAVTSAITEGDGSEFYLVG